MNILFFAWRKYALIALGIVVIILLNRLNKSNVLNKHGFLRILLSALYGLAASAAIFFIMYKISEGEIYPPQGMGAERVINYIFLCMSLFLPFLFALILGLVPEEFSLWRLIFIPWIALLLELLLIIPAGLVLHYSQHPEQLFGLAVALALLCAGGTTAIIIIILKR